MNEVYAIQSDFNAEIKLQKRHLVMKVKDTQQDIKKMKLEIQETEQKKMESEANC